MDKIAQTDATLLDTGFCFCLVSFHDLFTHDAVKIPDDNSIPLHHDVWGLLVVVMAYDDVSKLTEHIAYCFCIGSQPQAGDPVDDGRCFGYRAVCTLFTTASTRGDACRAGPCLSERVIGVRELEEVA